MAPHGTLKPMNQNVDYNTDYVTDAGRVVTNNMGAIHNGHTFSSHMALDELVYGTPWDVLIQTPEERYMHIKFIDMWINTGAIRVQIWEDIQSYTGGWVVDMHNRRRPSIISTSTTTEEPTTTPVPTTTGTTTTATTVTTTTATTTTPVPTTTEAPHIPSILAEVDLRLTWAEKERFIYTVPEAGVLPTYPGTTEAIIREGGIAVLGTAIEIDAYSHLAGERITADRWMDHEWIFKRDKMYLIRIWRTSPVVTTTATTAAPTTSTTTPAATTSTSTTTAVPTTTSTTVAPTTTSTTPVPTTTTTATTTTATTTTPAATTTSTTTEEPTTTTAIQ